MGSNLIVYLYAIPAILISLSFHEMAHAYASYRQGDPTAKMMGRLTMNPLKHLDPIGTLMLIASMFSGFGFGWAKPVPINPTYYKNTKRGTVLVSLAGPASNLLLAFLFSFPMAFIAVRKGIEIDTIFVSNLGIYSSAFSFEALVFNVCRFFYMINIGLATFNLLPIPPLDGSKIISAVLPTNIYFNLMKYERYIGLVFIALVVLVPGVLSSILSPIRWVFEGAFKMLASPLINLIT
ncbi:MAG: site-2 protease family protein [Clostridiaceae bacterium]|nr:site-2 protease family protein [Clostridiaceae bacterium]